MSAVVTTVLAAAVAALPTAETHCPGVIVAERFGSSPGTAITHDRDAVPEGSRVVVVEKPHKGGGTTVAVGLKGLQPDRTYGAHVHTKPCGPEPADSGPHYQNTVDPVQPSVDPAYANPDNEVWLDFTTNTRGSGGAVATVDWRFREGAARSVVVHEHATETGPGHAGMAGARLACVNVPFS
ncbi:superoxide dismutase family protein [Streptomyces sp. TRM68367]|uniref:superoxide dismutase family protein n=1 Tax=Streptomyces sp. TRM68367 TaxID=2758415 RepID=UPI00165B8045|nr:superoxide dismutase family protein [Streptomyces sp. TRM68367]MBC9729435.1 superoxide dismutase family protein [Streptomyces sp. TRM68367]